MNILTEFSNEDLDQIKSKNLSVSDIEKQISIFKAGIPHVSIKAPATIGNGILKLTEECIEKYVSNFESRKEAIQLLKFVPASGAATRMFKFLFRFLNEYKLEETSLNAYINKNKFKNLSLFCVGLEKFPFYDKILEHLKSKGIDYDVLDNNQKVWHFVNAMLNEDELNFGNFPKGLLPFHKYDTNRVVTAFKEHLYEASLYASVNGKSDLHFTISERFKGKFVEEFNRIKEDVEQKTGIQFNISYSYQKESTDTIAVALNNIPFRCNTGKLLFRPAGHGALIKNLNEQNADIIFIKNVDNVVVKTYRNKVAQYKKVLGGILLELQAKTFEYLKILEIGNVLDETLLDIENFATSQLNIKIGEPLKIASKKEKIGYFFEKLNRPIRVCGMVENEGEPGGGPFWIKDKNQNITLQIVESAQINLDDKSQKDAFVNATHFNPVDLVCGVKDYKGNKFDLEDFVDSNLSFITQKTKEGRPLKALELPGLWNGSMAFWNTIFVEVPILTFNPVKTVNDLLKSTHQIN